MLMKMLVGQIKK